MKTILLVEDDSFVIDFITQVLEQKGFQVKVAKNEFAALDIINNYETDIDLILSDIRMTFQSSGFDLLKNIKLKNSKDRIPFAFMTGKSDLKTVEEAIQLGADDFIVKPFDPDTLVNKINMLLNKGSGFPFAQRKLMRAAKVHEPISILSISEVGIRVLLPFEVVANSKIRLDGDVFDEIGIDSPMIKVHSVKQDPSNSRLFLVDGVFVGQTERVAQRIRRWITNHPDRSYANIRQPKTAAV